MQMKHKDVVNVFDATVEAIRDVLVHEHLEHYLNTVTCNNGLQLNMISLRVNYFSTIALRDIQMNVI